MLYVNHYVFIIMVMSYHHRYIKKLNMRCAAEIFLRVESLCTENKYTWFWFLAIETAVFYDFFNDWTLNNVTNANTWPNFSIVVNLILFSTSFFDFRKKNFFFLFRKVAPDTLHFLVLIFFNFFSRPFHHSCKFLWTLKKFLEIKCSIPSQISSIHRLDEF